jgi:hypothetical protein
VEAATPEELAGSHKGSPTQMTVLYGLRGEVDRAFHCLEEAHRYRQPYLCSSKYNPEWIAFDPIRAFTKCGQGLNLQQPET